MLEAGRTAPDFSLPGIAAGEPRYYNLYEPIRDGRVVVLLFGPVDFVPTVTPYLAAAGRAEWADRDDVETWAITTDSLFAHEAYADAEGIDCPMLTDRFSNIADAYDVVIPEFRGHQDVPGHAAVVVDEDWTIRFSWENEDPTSPPGVSPLVGVAETLSELLGEDVAAPVVDAGE